MGVDYTLLSDAADQFDTPADGEFRMFDGGTTHRGHRGRHQRQGDDLAAVMVHAQDPGLLRRTAARRPRRSTIRSGVAATDELLMKLSDLSGKAIPAEIEKERGRLIDAMADSQSPLHGKKYAIYGDPDFVYAMARFVMETGGEPIHCLATNGTTKWEEQMKALLASSPFGAKAQGLAGQGSVAHALAAVHRAGRFPDRQLLRQVSRARHRHRR